MKKKAMISVSFVVIAAVLFFFIRAMAFGEEEPLEPVTAYTVGADTAPSLDGCLQGEAGIAEIHTPDSGDSEQAETAVYDYKLEQSSQAMQRYLEQLTEAEQGFTVVDESGAETEAPDFTLEAGSVSLARSSEEEGSLFVICLDWAADTCTVTVSREQGSLKDTSETMTTGEAIEYFCSLEPTELNLKGSTMSDYQVLPVDGIVFVDGIACIKISVYQRTEPQLTKEAAGIYLLSGDKNHIYRLAQGKVTELTKS